MEETKERKNAVESYVLDMRSKLAESLAPYATDKARAPPQSLPAPSLYSLNPARFPKPGY